MPRPRFAFFPILLLLVALPLGAAEAPVDATDQVRERILRMTEFFDTMLPGVLQDRNITLHFTPKFSDFRDNEYVRYPVELRYGLGYSWELIGGLTPFGPNPFNAGRDHRWGPGELKLGARYDYGRLLNFFDDTTVGLETRIPLGKPPVELNDGYTHVKPFVSAARTLLTWPDVTFYTNLSYDRSVELSERAPPPPEVKRRNIIEAAPGFLFRPSELGYFAEYRLQHIADDQGTHLAHEIQVGTIWDVPLSRTANWHLPGKWQVELAYRIRTEEGYGRDQGIAARVNWRTTLREVITSTANFTRSAAAH
ncbi:MAG TPA: hypothetical protein VHD62_14565 [Opitutaceae bacterium]|nr:hypothetical protein [Opitutaceae bacterium]